MEGFFPSRSLLFTPTPQSSPSRHGSLGFPSDSLGSKGLSCDYVFLVNFDDRFLIPKSGLTDECVNKFLVALTRSRKKTFIFSQPLSEPTFVSWIDPERKSTTLKAR